MVPEPGTPSVSMGTKEPVAAELLAASGAATPRMSPLPKVPSVSVRLFSIEYVMALAMVAPAPGSTPTAKPTTLERSVPHQVDLSSSQLNSMRPVCVTMPALLWCCCSISSSSLMENTPMTTTTNWMPSERWMSPPVKR